MKLVLINSLLIFMLLQYIVNEEIPFVSFEKIIIPVGTHDYSYQFIDSNIPGDKDAFFYFQFPEHNSFE